MKAGFLTLGCRVNQYESQAISEKLERLGFETAKFDDKCDVYVINTCAVTEESVRKSRQMVRRALKHNPDAFVAVMGCGTQLDCSAFEKIDGVGYICGNRNKNTVVDAVSAWLDKQKKSFSKCSVVTPHGELEKMKISRFERARAYVKIQDGCNNKCAYCVIPSLRGNIVSRPADDILKEVASLSENGCHEVVLTGIETASYEYDLAQLIEKISCIDGIERIRMGSLEPSFVKPDFIDIIVNIPKVEHHFHLSVQSACDDVLRAMRRKYNTSMLAERIKYIREKMPDVMFSADVIVGFPGETDEMFQKTCDFLREAEFLHLHIFTYSKRPNTEAATMKNQVAESVKNERNHILSELAEKSKKAIFDRVISEGNTVDVLAEVQNGDYIVGHSGNFIECAIPKEQIDMNDADFRGKMFRAVPVRTDGDLLVCDIV